MPRMTQDGWPAGDPRRFFDAEIDRSHLRGASPNVYRRAVWLSIGIVVGGGLVALGVWAIIGRPWWSIVIGAVAILVGLGLFAYGVLAGSAVKPYRGGQLVPGMVVEQADDSVQLLVVADTSRDPAAQPAFAYRLIKFRAREGTTFVAGKWIPCVMHGFAALPWSERWLSFDASPVSWATADPVVQEQARQAIPQAEWDQLLAGAQRIGKLRRSWNRLSRIEYVDLESSLRRPPTRLGVPVEWQPDGRARFVGSVSDVVSV